MKKAIWKFPLATGSDRQTIPMPVGSQIKHVGTQRGFIMLWAEVFPEHHKTEDRTFDVHGTGHPIDKGTYVGTVVEWPEGPFVWHIYEIKGDQP